MPKPVMTDAEWRRRAKSIIREFDSVLRAVKTLKLPTGHRVRPPKDTMFTLDVTSITTASQGASIIIEKPGTERSDKDQLNIDIRLFWPHLTRPCGDEKPPHYAIIYANAGARFFAFDRVGLFPKDGRNLSGKDLYAPSCEEMTTLLLTTLTEVFERGETFLEQWRTTNPDGFVWEGLLRTRKENEHERTQTQAA